MTDSNILKKLLTSNIITVSLGEYPDSLPPMIPKGGAQWGGGQNDGVDSMYLSQKCDMFLEIPNVQKSFLVRPEGQN